MDIVSELSGVSKQVAQAALLKAIYREDAVEKVTSLAMVYHHANWSGELLNLISGVYHISLVFRASCLLPHHGGNTAEHGMSESCLPSLSGQSEALLSLIRR